MQHFYFDHNATTPVAPEVLDAVVSCLGQTYGNASSIHYFGQGAKQRLEMARRQVAALIHANPAEVVFTGAKNASFVRSDGYRYLTCELSLVEVGGARQPLASCFSRLAPARAMISAMPTQFHGPGISPNSR